LKLLPIQTSDKNAGFLHQIRGAKVALLIYSDITKKELPHKSGHLPI
jgi:hypothetical protein